MDEGSVQQPGERDISAGTGDTWLDSLLDRVESDVEQLGRADLSRLVRLDRPSSELLAAGRRVERIRRRLQSFDTAYVVALEEGQEPARNGYPSTVAFLRAQLRLSPGEARARVRAAGACAARTEFGAGPVPPLRPVLAAAREGGELSAEHTAVIIDALDKLPERVAPQDVAAAEARLVGEASAFDPAGVARLGRRILDHVDPDGTLRDHSWKQRIRSATLTSNHDGTGIFRAVLTPEALETWQTVLDPLARPHPTGPEGPDPRSAGQRLHDAFHDAGARLLDAGDLPACGGTPATVVIHMTQEQYDAHRRGQPDDPPGVVETEHGALLPVAAAFAMADQAAVCTVVTDAQDVPLSLGRTSRIATLGQTIALAARDRGCTFPGCDRPAAWTQRHHVVPWHEGGRTDLDNLALVCGYHHRTFEGRGWVCVMREGRPHWIPPEWIDPRRRPIRNTYRDTVRDRAGP